MLIRKIANLTQGNRSATSYYCELKMLWSDFRALKLFPTRNLDILEALVKSDDSDILLPFLMGLNEEYAHVCNQILLMNPLPLPTVSRAH